MNRARMAGWDTEEVGKIWRVYDITVESGLDKD